MKISNEADTEWQDMIADEVETHDKIIENKDEFIFRKKLFEKALQVLNSREKEIIQERRLREKPKKLEELSKKFNISRERVRQIEEKAMQKLQLEISNIS